MKKLLLTAASAFIAVLTSLPAKADSVTNDDAIISGSLCVGTDCTNGENFNFDTIRLKENNVRIKFLDTSSAASFPTADWELIANESSNGGLNLFQLSDVDTGTKPFTILQGNQNAAFYMLADGRIGLGTATPALELNIKDGNSPTIRLEQDGSSGFTAQSWDIGANETNFFIRDASNSGKIPFKIIPNAPSNALYIAADGDVGLETSTPDGPLDVAHPSDANNHALFVSPAGYTGINIDNGHLPNGQFDVQTTGGISQFLVAADGKVGIGAGSTPSLSHPFQVYRSNILAFHIDSNGHGTFANDLTVTGTLNASIASTTAGSYDSGSSSYSGGFTFNDAIGSGDGAYKGSLFTVEADGGVVVDGGSTSTANATDGLFEVFKSDNTSVFKVNTDGTIEGNFNATVEGFESLTTTSVKTKQDLVVPGLLDVKNIADSSSFLRVETDGGVVIGGGAAPNATTGLLEVFDSSNNSIFKVASDGTLTGNFPGGTPEGFETLTTTLVKTKQDLTVPGGFDVRNVADAASFFKIESDGDVLLNGGASGTTAELLDVFNDSGTSVFKVVGTAGGSIYGDYGSLAVGDTVATGVSYATDFCTANGICVESNLSSRAYKNILGDINKLDVLDKVSELEITYWHYKHQDESIVHVGPFAEDFHVSFGLNGDKDDRIAKVDMDGIAFVSIQALNEKIQAQAQEIEQLKQENTQEIQSLRDELEQIKQLLQQ